MADARAKIDGVASPVCVQHIRVLQWTRLASDVLEGYLVMIRITPTSLVVHIGSRADVNN
jgi:hypothetical protein